MKLWKVGIVEHGYETYYVVFAEDAQSAIKITYPDDHWYYETLYAVWHISGKGASAYAEEIDLSNGAVRIAEVDIY